LLRLRSYRTGGGRRGNVAAGALRSLRSSVPLISSAVNRFPGVGGVDSESLDDAKQRGPLLLRTRDRAVTGADFEHLAREAAPEIARVKCVEAGAGEPGAVRVLVVPQVSDGPDGPGRIAVSALRPRDETFERIVESLDERRVIGVRVVVEMPSYHGVTVVARLRARRRAAPVEVQRLALDALYGYYHPVTGGPEGQGWPFGRPIQAGEVHAVLQRVAGVDFVEESLLFSYDVVTGQRGSAPTERMEIPSNGLVFSFGHQVRVEEGR
jgi:predicted phage baseplate assembly protein